MLLYHPSLKWSTGDARYKVACFPVLWTKLRSERTDSPGWEPGLWFHTGTLGDLEKSLGFCSLSLCLCEIRAMVCSTHFCPWGIWLMGKMLTKYFAASEELSKNRKSYKSWDLWVDRKYIIILYFANEPSLSSTIGIKSNEPFFFVLRNYVLFCFKNRR